MEAYASEVGQGLGFLGDGEVASRDAGLRSRFGERGRGVGSPPLSEIARTERLSVSSGSGDLTSKEDAGAGVRAGGDSGGWTSWDLKSIDGTAGETGRTVDVAGVVGATGGAAEGREDVETKVVTALCRCWMLGDRYV